MNPRVKRMASWTAGLVGGLAVVAICVAAIHASAAGEGSKSDDNKTFVVKDGTITAPDDALEAAGIRTMTLERANTPLTLTLTGRTGLDMEHVAHVHAQFGGKVTRVGPQLGDVVSGPESPKGATVLCVIESNDLAQAKSTYLQAKVQLKIDEDNLGRTRELVKSTVLAEKFLIDAESAVTKDRAALEAARQGLLVFGLTQKEIDDTANQVGRQRMDYVITAPRSGVIAEKGVSGGEIADPTINLFTVADTSTMWVWGDVYERDLRQIKVGEPIKIVFTSEPERVRTCKIDWISPVLDPNSHSIRVRGSLDNSDGHLLADMYGTMVVTVDQGNGALVVPSECVIRQGNDSYVFVLAGKNGNQTTYRRVRVFIEPVEVGFGTSGSAAVAETANGSNSRDANTPETRPLRVVSGLKQGDVVVRVGALGLFNEMEQQNKE